MLVAKGTWLRKIRQCLTCLWGHKMIPHKHLHVNQYSRFLGTVPYLDLSIHSSPLFSTLLCICRSVWPPPLHPCLSHPLCPCHTVACVVDGASWSLPPPQLGLHTKTSFQSQTQNYLLIVTQHRTPRCYLLKKKAKGDLIKPWHTSAFSHDGMRCLRGFTRYQMIHEPSVIGYRYQMKCEGGRF